MTAAVNGVHLTVADRGRSIAAAWEESTPTVLPVAGERSKLHGHLLDREVLRGPAPPTPDYVLHGLVREGDLVALVSSAKAGKSLLVLDRVLAAVQAGKSVVYLDAENGLRDVHTRLHALGHGDADLAGLHYVSFPMLSLDLPESANELLRFLAELEADTGRRPDLVVLDTASRFLSADENDSAGWLAMYRLALQPIKRAGIAVLRLDHLGKDTSRGARGSSAKSGDVDAVFELTADQAGDDDEGRRIALECTMQRSGTYVTHQVLVRGEADGVLGHRTPGAITPGGRIIAEPGDATTRIIAALDAAGAPSETGRDRARELVGERFPDAPKRAWEAAVRRRKANAEVGTVLAQSAAGWTMPTTPYGPAQ